MPVTITRVQKATNYDTGVGTSFAGTLTSNVTAGNLLILALNSFLGTVVSISDTATNTYTPIGTAIYGEDFSYLYYVKNAIAGSTVVTVNMDSIHVKSLGIYEYSGLHTQNPLDKTSFGSAGTSTTASPGAITPAANNSLVFSLGGDFALTGTAAPTPAAGYTLIDHVDPITNERFYTQELFQTVAASTTASFTLGTPANNRAIVASFTPLADFVGYKTLLGVGL